MRPWRVRLLICGLAGTAAVAGCGSSSSSDTDESSPSASPSARAPLPQVESVEAAGAARVELVGGRDWVAVAGGSAWAASDALDQLDGRSGRLLRTVPLPGPACLAMDTGFDALWVGTCDTPAIVRVDVRTGRPVATIPVDAELYSESSVAAGEGAVWALADGLKLIKVDPRTNTASSHTAPAGATAVRAGAGALWVTSFGTGTLLRVDPATLEVTATIPVGSGPRFLALGEGGVWVLNQTDGTVSRVDPATDEVVATIPVAEGRVTGGDIAVGGGAVWARVSDSLVAEIDPATNTVVHRYGPADGSGSVAADDSAVWISAHDSNSVWRLPRS